MFPFSEIAGPDGQRIGVSMVGATVVFVVLFKLIHALLGANSDAAMLFGTLIPTFAGVSVPYFVVKMMGPKSEPAATPAGGHV